MILSRLIRGGVLALLASTAKAEDITVFAAASLSEALGEAGEIYEAETGHNVRLSLAGSSVLAWQIERGAPADLFISANPDWMDNLEQAGRINPDSRVDLLGNTLVLIAHEPGAIPGDIGDLSMDFDLPAVLGDGVLAMGLIDGVPAGQYGRAALLAMGQWDALSGQVAQADNVRAVLNLVILGEASHGIVYASDLLVARDVRVVGAFPENTHPPIIYPAAMISENTAASDFLDFLQSPVASEIFTMHGFEATP